MFKYLYKSGNYKYDCLCTLSGGIDSTVLAHLIVSQGKNPLFVYVNYGAKAYEGEVRCSIETCKKLNKDYIEIPFDLYKQLSTCSLIQGTDSGNDDDSFFLEGRNGILGLVVGILASSLNLNEVYIGSNADDLYADTTTEFYDAVNRVIEIGFQNKVKIVTPFLEKGLWKKDVIILGTTLSIDWTKDTHSCYKESVTCCDYSTCVACRNRRDDFEKAGLKDPFHKM